MTKLLQAEIDLVLLKRHIVSSHGGRGWHEVLDPIKVRHNKTADKNNRSNARAFCYVLEGSKVITCSCAIEHVSRRARVGLLAHEIAHIVLYHAGSMGYAVDHEVRADMWVKDFLPEAGYSYRDHKYTSPHTGEPVTAKHLEHVSASFLRQMT